jgi:acetylornithine deacetylase/succinyl-diaminopimelate desuccinylase-like protein
LSLGGASDDKGSMFIPILAVEALFQAEEALSVNVKFFLAGQEETKAVGFVQPLSLLKKSALSLI